MFDDIVLKYAAQYQVPPAWIEAVILTESSGNPEAHRAEPQINDASYGLMQLLYATARGLGFTGQPEELYDPDTNIHFGTKLLADLKRRYGTDVRRIYSAYNSGKPDAYLTSDQVGANVRRFLSNLETSVSGLVQKYPAATAAGGGAILAVLVAAILYSWHGGH